MKLNYKVFGKGRALIILHGLLGSLDNWQTLARQMAEEFRVYIVDQRNHGKSPHTDEMDYDLMAGDLLELLDDEGIPSVNIIGHSMGGKTAMHFALENPGRMDKLVVVDIAPKAYSAGHTGIFEALFSIDPRKLESREEAEKALSEKISDQGIRLFLLKNLDRKKNGGFEWKMNLEGLWKNYEKISGSINSNWPYTKPVLFVKGERSEYISDEDKYDIKNIFYNAKFAEIKNAGHWVHAEKPKEFLEVVMDFLMTP